MSYYVDCACPDHDIWLPFDDEAKAVAYYEARACRDKVVYRDRSESDPPFPRLVTVKESQRANVSGRR